MAQAQPLSEMETAYVKAGIVLATFDDLQQKCERSGGFDVAQRREVEAWQSTHGVDALRTHLNGPGLSPALREQVRVASAQVVRQVASGVKPCLAAVSLTRTADAQFANRLPRLPANSTPVPAAKPEVEPASTRFAADMTRVATDIEGFAFDSCTRIGYGGMVMFTPCPVVLFRDGSALTDVEGLSHPQGMAAHRAAQPKHWTQWRRTGERIQLMKEDVWKNITYTAVYSTLPKNFRLDGRFSSTRGGGNTALGGGQAVIAWSDYLFRPDGTVQRGGGAGASSMDSGVAVTTSSRAAGKSGHYHIEGLTLVIEYDDGSSERRVIIADPKDGGKGTMWLDGEGYVVRK
jgi:hypothetical protein